MDVCRCANFTQGHLNRQIITLLSSLGVKKEYFVGMQENYSQFLGSTSLDNFRQMLSRFNTLAEQHCLLFYREASFVKSAMNDMTDRKNREMFALARKLTVGMGGMR